MLLALVHAIKYAQHSFTQFLGDTLFETRKTINFFISFIYLVKINRMKNNDTILITCVLH